MYFLLLLYVYVFLNYEIAQMRMKMYSCLSIKEKSFITWKNNATKKRMLSHHHIEEAS